MRFTKTFLFIALFLLVIPNISQAKNPKTVTIGFIPSEPNQKLKKSALKLAAKIQKRIGVTTNIYIPKDYQGLIDAMKSGKVDFAFFTAMSFVFAEKSANAKVLLKKVWGEHPFYHSVILVKKDSKIKKLSELKGKSFAFVDKRSTSGYLYPSVHFKSLEINPKTFFSETMFSGNHQAAVNSVRTGQAAATSVYADDKKGMENAWTKYFPKDKNGFRVLWISDPIPNDPFCVRDKIYQAYPHLTHEVMFALLEMKDDPKGNLLKEILGIEKLQFATSRQYEPVRRMVRTLQLGLK